MCMQKSSHVLVVLRVQVVLETAECELRIELYEESL
jgi:hypothetical protein